MNSTSLFVSYWSFQVINSLMRKYMSLELLVCSKNFLNESFTKHTVCIQFYLQHSLQLPWASYVSVSRRRHISMYVFLPSSLSDFVSSALRKMKKKIVIVYLWFPCSLLLRRKNRFVILTLSLKQLTFERSLRFNSDSIRGNLCRLENKCCKLNSQTFLFKIYLTWLFMYFRRNRYQNSNKITILVGILNEKSVVATEKVPRT